MTVSRRRLKWCVVLYAEIVNFNHGTTTRRGSPQQLVTFEMDDTIVYDGTLHYRDAQLATTSFVSSYDYNDIDPTGETLMGRMLVDAKDCR